MQPKTEQTIEQMLGQKVIHLAKLVDQKGNVSPWCADPPRRINLKKESWSNRVEAVNCFVCINAARDHHLNKSAALTEQHGAAAKAEDQA